MSGANHCANIRHGGYFAVGANSTPHLCGR